MTYFLFDFGNDWSRKLNHI